MAFRFESPSGPDDTGRESTGPAPGTDSHLPMHVQWRARAFAALAAIGTRRPVTVVTLTTLVVVGAAFLVPGIRVSTSRYGLVARDNPYQARLFRFFDRFGY